MSLMNCPECKAQISAEAKSCPQCGYPIAEKQQGASGCFGAFLVILVVPLVLWLSTLHGVNDGPKSSPVAGQPSTSTFQAAAEPTPSASPEPPQAATNAQTASVWEERQDTKATAQLIAERAKDGVRQIDGRDLAIQSHKWDGSVIEIVVNCIYADASEFRCVADNARVDFEKFYPEALEESLIQDCDTVEKSVSQKCSKRIRFIYDGFGEADVGGLIGKTTIVRALNNVGLLSGRKKQKY